MDASPSWDLTKGRQEQHKAADLETLQLPEHGDRATTTAEMPHRGEEEREVLSPLPLLVKNETAQVESRVHFVRLSTPGGITLKSAGRCVL